jgi:hypothetical protein
VADRSPVFLMLGLGEIRSLFICGMPYVLCGTETYGRNCQTASLCLVAAGAQDYRVLTLIR